MATTTALFIFIIIVGLSYQQDAVDERPSCPAEINNVNQACLADWNIDPSNSGFCDEAFGLSKCLDASCLEETYRGAIHAFVPALLKPGSCPICSTVPSLVTESRKTCTAWGLYHVIDFDERVMLCPRANSTVLLTNEYFTITALTNTTVDERLTTGIIYPGITGIRLDYHGCAVYSKTWLSREDWDSRRIPPQGWFPHLINIAQNTTEAVVNLMAMNTDFIIRKAGRYMSISIRTGTADVSEGLCTASATICTAEDLVSLYPIATDSLCTGLPSNFQRGKFEQIRNWNSIE